MSLYSIMEVYSTVDSSGHVGMRVIGEFSCPSSRVLGFGVCVSAGGGAFKKDGINLSICKSADNAEMSYTASVHV